MEVYRNKQGQLHRIGNPAIISHGGTEEFWINGVQITEEQFNGKQALAILLISC